MTAAAFVLGGVAATRGAKLLWDEYQKISGSTPYDLVIRINSLTALVTSGWEIVLGQNTKEVDPKVLTSEQSRGVVV
jgi:hypothetical protein